VVAVSGGKVRRALRITGCVYLAGAIAVMAILLIGHYKYLGSIPVRVLPFDVAMALLWPAIVVVIVLDKLGFININIE
jgi:hypothetical protein